jgi:hypothetical protein
MIGLIVTNCQVLILALTYYWKKNVGNETAQRQRM